MKAIKINNSTREECIWTLSSIESYKKWTQTNKKKKRGHEKQNNKWIYTACN
jgi:hypothetical protein